MAGNRPFDEPDAVEPYNDAELVSVLSRFVRVDRASGEPVAQAGFSDADPRAQAVALMLYRHVADSLGQLEGEVPVEAGWLVENTDLFVADAKGLPDELAFVVERRGHLEIPRGELGAAVEYLAERA